MKYLFMMIFGLMMLASCAKEDVRPVAVDQEQSIVDCECEGGLSEREDPTNGVGDN